MLLGDTDASGNTSATVLHQFGDHLRVKLQAQTQVRTSLLNASSKTEAYDSDLARQAGSGSEHFRAKRSLVHAGINDRESRPR